MRKALSFSALALGAVLALSACGGAQSSAPSPTAPSVEPLNNSTPSPTAAGNKSPRGNLIKKLGEPAGITNKDGKPTVNFTVNSITPDAPCTGKYTQPAQNGHFVVLDVAVETTADFVSSTDQRPLTFDMSPGMFKFVGKSGTTYNGNLGTGPAFSCLDDTEQLSAAGRGVGPAEKATGKIALDLPEATGTLVYQNYLVGNIGGWEYNF